LESISYWFHGFIALLCLLQTNGSLPREGKQRLASPARSLPPTSPLLAAESEFFTFDRSPDAAAANQPLSCPQTLPAAAFSSPCSSSSPSSAAAVVNGGPSPFFAAQPGAAAASPRTRIKTIAGGSRLAAGGGSSSRESSVETLRPGSSGSPAQTLRSPAVPVGCRPSLFSISDYQVPMAMNFQKIFTIYTLKTLPFYIL
jgi:hypothetical protein